MARKRMIDPTIWEDEEFGSLSMTAKVLFIGLFSNADDEGRIRANTAYLKSTIFMYDSIGQKVIEDALFEICSKLKAVLLYEIDGKRYIQLKSWHEYQKQHKDRIQESTLPPYEEGASELVNHMPDNDGHMPDNDGVDKVRLSKVRVGEGGGEKKKETSPTQKACITSLTPCDEYCLWDSGMKKNVHIIPMRNKAQKLWEYIEDYPKKYTSFHKTLLNWIDLDLKKSYISEMSEAELLDMPLEHPDKVKARREAQQVMRERGIL